MTPKEWDRLKPLLDRALAMEPAERNAFIEGIRRDDETTALKLSALIASGETHSIDVPFAPLPDLRPPGDCSFAAGELVLDRFRIVRFLGRGGMGEVYEANDIHLGRVALKTIRGIALSEQSLARFHREVRLARKIAHPNVCRIHDLFAVPARPGRAPTSFLTMEYLSGVTLAQRIAASGPLPLAEAESVALQICSAVGAIHDAGIIHRDLKPCNIMLTPDPKAVVMDLGLARETDSEAGDEYAITRANAVMGTPEYMAPEQFQAKPAIPATDVYALGIVLYEMVTGSRPFHAATPMGAAVMRGKRLAPASSLRPDLPRRWDEAIETCLQFDPERRFGSATAVAAALQGRRSAAFLAGFRQPRIALGAAALIAAVAIGGSALWYQEHSYPRPSPDAQHWYDEGVAALRAGTFYKATQSLTRAVSLSPDFALAHARLADAWAELEFTGKAKDEMLRASTLQTKGRMPELDARYIDAVRASLTYDYAAALADYDTILNRLPAAEKAYGYVDLGRAQEKAGEVPEALRSYEEAARRTPEYPASFVHVGILDVRRGDDDAGNAAFTHAESLYRAAGDVEGVAEVAYERGYAASLKGDNAQARTLLQQSLRTAEDISSVQLEIRSLLRLSAVEDMAERPDQSIEVADHAIQLARENGLDYWASDGLVRVGNGWLTKNDIAKAELSFEEALHLATRDQRPRLEANARLSLASIRSSQDKPDEATALARAALDYYKPAGFDVESTSALVLIVRSERDKADFKKALPDALQALELARRSKNALSIMQVEELTGGVLLHLENYPEALVHFNAARDAARGISQNVEYETLHCADALWQLGRYDEAKRMLASIPPEIAERPRIAVALDLMNGRILLSQRHARGAREIALNRLSDSAGLGPSARIEFELLAGEAAAQSGARAQSASFCQMAVEQAEKESNGELTARANVCLANAEIAAGAYREALPPAESALHFFEGSGQEQSRWRTLLAIAKVHAGSGDSSLAKKMSSNALDIMGVSEHTWGNPAFETYSRRPDIEAERHELTRFPRK